MNLYKSIWLNPKRTFDEVIVNNKEQSIIVLPIVLAGMVIALDLTIDMQGLFGEAKIMFMLFLLISIPLGIGAAFLFLRLILPGLIKLSGRIWNGAASMPQIANVCSISSLPNSIIIINQIALLLLGKDPDLDNVNSGIKFVLWLWSLSLLIIGVSRIQRFSYGLALLNILIGNLPILLIALLRG